MKLYLAGPMTGYESFNFPEFHKQAAILRQQGHEVWSPAEHDIDVDGFDPDKDESKSMDYYMQRDLPAVCAADAVAVLNGWERSDGACLEVYVGQYVGKPILCAYSLLPVDDVRKYLKLANYNKAQDTGEKLVTDPETGGQKGQKLARFDLLPADAMWALAELYGKGAAKYSANNWLKGYRWSLSYGAAGRHGCQFWQGEDMDQETKTLHAICAAWHWIALAVFQMRALGTDDRPGKKRNVFPA